MNKFVPALHYDFLTPFYDACTRLFFGKVFKKIADAVAPQDGQKILDLGCGPGNLLIALKRHESIASTASERGRLQILRNQQNLEGATRAPKIDITGLDIDSKILAIARKKLEREKIDVRLIEASAAVVPLNETFDIVVSTLMIHHLTTEEKKAMIREAFRLTRPGGQFYLYDFAPPNTRFSRFLSGIYRRIEEIDDGINNKYAEFMKEAGFKNIRTVFRSTLFQLLVGEKTVA